MMVGAAFILLKVGRFRPESAKQAEIRLARLLTILRIAHFGREGGSAAPDGHVMGVFKTNSAGYG
jgi:hypothetical protein